MIILGLFVLIYFSVGLSVKKLLDWFMKESSNQFSFFIDSGLPIFDFVDIWQNLAFITFLFKYILAFVVIISVCLEYSNKTIRQNFIDGLSRKDFLYSKVGLIAFLTVLSGTLLTLLGLTLGLLYSPVKSLPFIIMNMEFVLAHMLEVFTFLSFALFLATLIRRTGFAIVLFVFYATSIEPIITSIMKYQYELPVWYFPLKSVSNIVRLPFEKYIFREVQDYVALQDVAVASAWTAIFLFLTYWLIKKRDV
jgi:ABC-type transport system involved in multi-copper enzyme maturation permease subunit